MMFLDLLHVNESSILSVFGLAPLDPSTVPTVIFLMECNIQYEEDLNFVKDGVISMHAKEM
jgi:hypothetical protein